MFSRKQLFFLPLVLMVLLFSHSVSYCQARNIVSTNIGVEFVYVKGGHFQMGDLWDVGFSEDEKPVHTVELADFWMSKFEITNYQFCIFLNEMGNVVEGGVPWIDLEGEDCLISKKGRRFEPKRGYSYHPVVKVSWWGARAFAEWMGCRLPTEAEWEYAARSEGKDIVYPHGARLTHNDANFAGTGGNDKWMWTSPVGRYPPNSIGLYDMAGNVWERCNDWFDASYYRTSPSKSPLGPDEGIFRTMRGGSWDYSRHNCRTSIRGMARPDKCLGDIGFRIVRDISHPITNE